MHCIFFKTNVPIGSFLIMEIESWCYSATKINRFSLENKSFGLRSEQFAVCDFYIGKAGVWVFFNLLSK